MRVYDGVRYKIVTCYVPLCIDNYRTNISCQASLRLIQSSIAVE